MAVLQQDSVLTLTQRAFAAGIRHGMRRAGAATVAPHIALLERDLLQEKMAFDAVALALLQFTPEVATADDASLLLSVAPSLRLFGGVLALCRQLRHCVQQLGFNLQLGMAPTAQAAWLFAHGRQAHRAIRRQTAQVHLHRLPCSLLPAATPYLDWLHGAGCRTLGALRRLPRAGLKRRTDAALLLALDQAYGDTPQLFNWIQPPLHFHMRTETHDRIEYSEGLLFYVRRLLLQLCGWLTALQQAVTVFDIRFEHERGRSAQSPTLLEIRLAEPTWHETHLTRLLRERLAQTKLKAPVIAVQLEVRQLEAMRPPNEGLFPEPGGSAGDFHRLLELLTARLGEARVLMPAIRQDYRPSLANGWQTATQRPGSGSEVQHWPQRPFWLLPQPLPLEVRQERPFYRSGLRLIQGPERIESGWWDDGREERDYFVGLADDGSRYWIYRERSKNIRWFLHGLFA